MFLLVWPGPLVSSLIGLSGGLYFSQRIGQSRFFAKPAQPPSRMYSIRLPERRYPYCRPQLSGALTTCQMLPQKPTHADARSRLIILVIEGDACYCRTAMLLGCDVSQLWIPKPNGGAPDWPGQVILVSVTQQWLWAYQDGKLVFATPVTTGMPWLWTPLGVYHITSKVEDTVFYSPWPPRSPFYYTPEHVDYALFFRQKGFYIHDAPWRQAFGPGTEVPHTDPDGTYETGSHGCVNVTYDAGQWLYNWTVLGATVDIMAN